MALLSRGARSSRSGLRRGAAGRGASQTAGRRCDRSSADAALVGARRRSSVAAGCAAEKAGGWCGGGGAARASQPQAQGRSRGAAGAQLAQAQQRRELALPAVQPRPAQVAGAQLAQQAPVRLHARRLVPQLPSPPCPHCVPLRPQLLHPPAPCKCLRTFSATSTGIELECVFFSVTPNPGK